MDADPRPQPDQDPTRRGEVGARVRELRQARRLTLRELAQRCETGAARMASIEEGREQAPVRVLAAVADALGVDVASLEGPSPLDAASLAGRLPAHEGDWRHYPPLTADPVLGAAVAEFLERGYARATRESIAARAGVSAAELDERYPATVQLLLGVFALALDDLRSRLAAALTEADSPLERFTLAVECLSLFHAHRHDVALVCQEEMRTLDPASLRQVVASRVATQRTLDATVVAGVDAGLFTTARPREAARAVAAMCVGITFWFQSTGHENAEQVADHHVDFALALVGHRSQRSIGEADPGGPAEA